MKELIELIARSLVDHPDDVRVSEVEGAPDYGARATGC